jgi:hypothetical protein
MSVVLNVLRLGAIGGVVAWAGYTLMVPQPSPPQATASVAVIVPASPAPPAPTAASPAPEAPTFTLQAPAAETKSTEPPAAPTPTPVAVETPVTTETTVSTEALEGGRFKVAVAAPGRAGEAIQVSYGGANFVFVLDAKGQRTWTLDAFAGSAYPMTVRFADGTKRDVAVEVSDLDAVTKVAVIWQAPVNLDLHAFEYGASSGDAGHIWEGAASSIVRAREIARAGIRARGALTTKDNGAMLGDKLEVYTLYHGPNEQPGSIAFAVDYETRGDKPDANACGQAPLAAIPFTIVTLSRNGPPKREAGVLTAAPCNATLTSAQRLDRSLLPVLRTKN